MPVYEYKAIDINGKNSSGVINSESALAVRQKLRNSGIFPVSIKEVDDIPQKKEARNYFNLSRFNRVKPSEVSMMTRQLATLISAGFPLVTAFDALIPQTHSTAFKKVLAQCKRFNRRRKQFFNCAVSVSVCFSTDTYKHGSCRRNFWNS